MLPAAGRMGGEMTAAVQVSPFRAFCRVVSAAEYPDIVRKAINDGLAKARECEVIPIAVQLALGDRAVLDWIADGRGVFTKHPSLMLLPDMAEEQLQLCAPDIRGGDSILTTIYACDIPELAEICLEDIADGVLPVRLNGAIGLQPNLRFAVPRKDYAACRIDPPGPQVH